MNAEVQVVITRPVKPGEDIVIAGNRASEHTKNAKNSLVERPFKA